MSVEPQSAHRAAAEDPDLLALPPASALIVDLDGTLVDTVGTRIDAWATALRHAGVPVERSDVAPLIGSDGRRLARDLATRYGRPIDHMRAEEIDREAGRLFDLLNKDPAPLPGASALLRTAEALGLPWAIATSSRPEQVVASIRALELDKVPVVIDGSHVASAKPAPDLFLRAAEALGVAAPGCWCVGDSTWDMRAAAAANMIGIGVTSGTATGEELYAAGGQVVIRSLDILVAGLRPASSSDAAI